MKKIPTPASDITPEEWSTVLGPFTKDHSRSKPSTKRSFLLAGLEKLRKGDNTPQPEQELFDEETVNPRESINVVLQRMGLPFRLWRTGPQTGKRCTLYPRQKMLALVRV